MADDIAPEENPEVEAAPAEISGGDHNSGMGSKAVAGGILIVLGGVLALWLGPKIAPILPSGLAPVAAWLTPGGEVSDEAISDLRLELEGKLAALPAPISDAEVEGIITGKTEALAAQITDLTDQIAATDGTDIESRLASLELKTDGLRAELSSLTTQLTQVSSAGGSISTENTAQIATYAAALEGLKAEIATLATQNGALSQRIDQASVVADRQVAEAEGKVTEVTLSAETERNNTAIRDSLGAIETALTAGQPLDNALADFTEAGGGEIPQALTDSSSGVATMAELRADFPEAAHVAIRASITASAGDGLLSSAGAFLKAQVATRSLTPQEGLAPDAVLSRAEAALKRDDLAGALAEIDALPAAVISDDNPMRDWVDAANERLDAITAYGALVSAAQSE